MWGACLSNQCRHLLRLLERLGACKGIGFRAPRVYVTQDLGFRAPPNPRSVQAFAALGHRLGAHGEGVEGSWQTGQALAVQPAKKGL
jgi:hypothetical protein